MRVLGIIQARFGSERLPGKILLPLAGRPLLEVLVRRVAAAAVDEWWLATTREPQDDLTAAWGEALGLHVYRGSTDDVLSRFTAIIRQRRPEWFFRLTADDPFADAALLNAMLAALPAWCDVLTLPEPTSLPLGYVAELARSAAVLEAEHEIPADQAFHRTHVLSWLYCPGHVAALAVPPAWPARPQWRWTIDYPADYVMARELFARLGDRWDRASYQEIVALLDRHPELVALNQLQRQKMVEEG